eukprot:4186297-Amphidinium_carterae.1
MDLPQQVLPCKLRLHAAFCHCTGMWAVYVGLISRPPAFLGLKNFPDCLWCKRHKGILLPVDKFKHKIGTRED